jgi:hypothetical protein
MKEDVQVGIHSTHARNEKYVENFRGENLNGRGRLRDLGVGGRMILTFILRNLA